MNLYKTTRFIYCDHGAEIKSLVDRGLVPSIAIIPNFSDAEVYFDHYGTRPATGNEALDAPRKSTGFPNLNNLIYVRAANDYFTAFGVLLRYFPEEYARAVVNEVFIFFSLSSNLYFDTFEQWGRIDTIDLSGTIFNVTTLYLVPSGLAGAYIGSIVVFTRRSLAVFDRAAEARDRRAGAMGLFIAFTLAYVLVVANVAELGEGNLYRVPVDPFLTVGTALLADGARRRLTGSGRFGRTGLPPGAGFRADPPAPPQAAPGVARPETELPTGVVGILGAEERRSYRSSDNILDSDGPSAARGGGPIVQKVF